MATCDNSNNDGQALIPNFSCSPDLSQLLFRFVERKSIGIVKGNNENGVVNMSDFFIPIDTYSLSTITLCENESQKIQLGSNLSKSPRREEVEFDISDFSTIDINEDTTANLRLLDNSSTLIAETGFFPAPNFSTFITNLKDFLTDDFKKLSTYHSDDEVSKFVMKSIDDGNSYQYELIFDASRATHKIVTFLLDLEERTLTNPTAVVYIEGDWDPGNIVAMEDLGNNKYAYSLELEEGITYNYFFHDGPTISDQETVDAPCNTGVGGARQITVGSSDTILPVVCFNNCTACSGFSGTLEPTIATRQTIQETLNGEILLSALRYPEGAFKVLMLFVRYCEDCSEVNERFIEYAKSSDVTENGINGASWMKMGNILLLSGTDNIEETDNNLIENIYVRNTQECPVKIETIIAI